MSTRRGGLGRNLSALLGANSALTLNEAKPQPTLLKLPTLSLQPGQYQPRTIIEEDALQELAQSIQKQGVLQPLLVRLLPTNQYEIIAGERRWRAAQIAGLAEIPVIVHTIDDETAIALALIENLQRESLNIVDQARAMGRLIKEFSLTHQEIAQLLSISRTTVTNALRLLQLPEEILDLLDAGNLDMGHARALLTLEKETLLNAAQIVLNKKLSVRETEALVQRLKNPIVAKYIPPLPDADMQSSLQTLTQHFQTKVQLKTKKSGGALILHYSSPSELESMIHKMLQFS